MDTTKRQSQPEQPTWRDLAPWEGTPSRGDKLLLAMIFIVPAFYLLTYPVRPFLVAEQPVLLQLLVGSKAATGAAAAYAGIGQLPLWLVVVAGIVGMAKFDWLFWLAGRKWGLRMVELMTGGPSGRRKWADRLQNLPGWLMPVLVVASRLPGMPGPIIWIIAGMNGMRLTVFLVADLLASALVTAAVVAAGYSAGEHGVALIQVIDSYALWISLGLVFAIVGWQSWKQSKQAKKDQQEQSTKNAQDSKESETSGT